MTTLHLNRLHPTKKRKAQLWGACVHLKCLYLLLSRLPLTTSMLYALQLSQLQLELEEEWKAKSQQALASAKEQHSRELLELTEQRDALQVKLTQLQEKVGKPALGKPKHKKQFMHLISRFISWLIQAVKVVHNNRRSEAVLKWLPYGTSGIFMIWPNLETKRHVILDTFYSFWQIFTSLNWR